jgi:hypothetical protein
MSNLVGVAAVLAARSRNTIAVNAAVRDPHPREPVVATRIQGAGMAPGEVAVQLDPLGRV